MMNFYYNTKLLEYNVLFLIYKLGTFETTLRKLV